jgi:outer membrane receptor protein involved in Fe transport
MKNFAILFAMHCFISANAQSLTGSVKDEAGKAISSATISLLKAKDSSTIKFSVSDRGGNFTFSHVPEGNYFISITCVGYINAFSSSFIYKGGLHVVPVIILLNNKKEMANVTVQSSRSFIEMHLDRMVVNVDASPANAGTNVLEVLAKSPSINVDMDDNISLNGKQGVLILLDGKRTYLSSKDLATLLKSMPSSSIDQIEIMTTPPAKYDADGMAGVINIKTKKSKNDGWNGSVTTSFRTGFFNKNGTSYLIPSSQNNVTFNYKKNKVNFFGSAGFNSYKGRFIGIWDKTYFTQAGTVNGYNYFVVNSTFSGNYSPLNLGIDYTINKKDLIGVAASTMLNTPGNSTRDRISEVKDANGQTLINYNAFLNREDEFNKTTGNINWKHNLDTLGHEFSLDADYVRYHFPSDEELVTNYINGSASQLTYLNNTAQTSTTITAFKGDYTRPIKKGRIEAGVKTSIVHTRLDNEYFRFLNNKWETQPGFNNRFSYKENINAVYLNMNKQIKKWSLQTGLRLETMASNGRQVLTNAGFKKNKTGLFPSIFASYDIDKNNTAKLSFSRRINRPQFYALMPYLSVVDSLDVWHGNPDLKPEHSNKIEASYSLQSKYFFVFSYSVTHDVVRYIAGQIGTQKATEFYPANIDKYKNLSLTISSPFKPAKWWDVNAFTSLYANKYYGFQNDAAPVFYITLTQNIINSFKLGKSLKAEVIINYTTEAKDEIFEAAPFLGNFSIGFQKQVLKEKGNLTVNVSDPFEWYEYKFKAHYLRLYEEGSFRNPSRSINLSFNYRFGKVNNQSRQRTTASQEEQNR